MEFVHRVSLSFIVKAIIGSGLCTEPLERGASGESTSVDALRTVCNVIRQKGFQGTDVANSKGSLFFS